MQLVNMQKLLGANGISIWKKANGIYDIPVVAYSERKSISKEHMFEKGTIDMNVLRKVLFFMIDELAFDLRRVQKLTACLTLKIRYSNFDTETKQVCVPYTSSGRVLFSKVFDLFSAVYFCRMLIRLVSVKLSHLESGSYQVNLFDDTVTDIGLSKAMDRVKIKYGTQSVMRGISL